MIFMADFTVQWVDLIFLIFFFLHTNPSCFHRYGFGSEGSVEYKIGPDKDLVYDVTLKDFKQVGCGSVFHLCFKLKKNQWSQTFCHYLSTG